MKYLLLFSLLTVCMLQVKSQLAFVKSPAMSINNLYHNESKPETAPTQADQEYGRMSAAAFKSQEYCRAELERFEYEAHFSIISATVYFSGANFKGVERGAITSSSLKPISALMTRCIPGSIVIFDDVKVVGPDKKIRTIPGMSVRLY